MSNSPSYTTGEDETAQRVLEHFKPALDALAAGKRGKARGRGVAFAQTYAETSVCALDQSGAFAFVRIGKDGTKTEILRLKPRETRALVAFWHDIVYAQVLQYAEEQRPPREPAISGDLRDVLGWVSGIVNAAINMDVQQWLTPEAAVAWQRVYDENMFEAPQAAPLVRRAYLLCLDALLASPGALERVAAAVRDDLLAADPTLSEPPA